MPTTSDKSESEFLRRLREQIGGLPARSAASPQDFVDDMAAIEVGADPLLWTVDTLTDGVDFESARHSWYQIGRKAMAVNLSDCAAMAARPISALCAVVLNNRLGLDDALALHQGAHELGLRFACPLVGGDTNSWDAPTVITICVAARAEAGQRPVGRAGACPGDHVCLTGPVGGSVLGRHLTFEPRVELALAINRQLAPHAMIDISDGLALDLWRILEASGYGATLDAAAVDAMTHPDAVRLAQQDGRPAREHALCDGEDFELIVVVPPTVSAQMLVGLGLRGIGEIEESAGLHLREADGRRVLIEPCGWEHFR